MAPRSVTPAIAAPFECSRLRFSFIRVSAAGDVSMLPPEPHATSAPAMKMTGPAGASDSPSNVVATLREQYFTTPDRPAVRPLHGRRRARVILIGLSRRLRLMFYAQQFTRAMRCASASRD